MEAQTAALPDTVAAPPLTALRTSTSSGSPT